MRVESAVRVLTEYKQWISGETEDDEFPLDHGDMEEAINTLLANHVTEKELQKRAQGHSDDITNQASFIYGAKWMRERLAKKR
jgi:predicted metalloprotease